MINRVVLLGRLTRDIDLRRTNNGMAVVSFSLAVDSTRKDAEGNNVANFINCIAFGKIAETMERFCTKGSQIAVDGSLQTRRYQRRDGTNATATEVIVNQLTLCGSRNNQPTREDSFDSNVSTSSSSDEMDYSQMDLADDDLPF